MSLKWDRSVINQIISCKMKHPTWPTMSYTTCHKIGNFGNKIKATFYWHHFRNAIDMQNLHNEKSDLKACSSWKSNLWDWLRDVYQCIIFLSCQFPFKNRMDACPFHHEKPTLTSKVYCISNRWVVRLRLYYTNLYSFLFACFHQWVEQGFSLKHKIYSCRYGLTGIIKS